MRHQPCLFSLMLLLAGPAYSQLYIGAGSSLHSNGNVILTLNEGSLQNDGTFTPGTGTVIFNSNASQSTSGTHFHHLVVNQPNAPANVLTLTGDATVDGTLTITSGRIATGSHKLVLGPAASVAGETDGNYVMGTLESSRIVANNTVNFGDMGVVINAAGSGDNLGAVTVTRKTGTQTLDNSYIQDGVGRKSIDRIWTISPATQPGTGVDVTLSWLPENDNGITDFSASLIWKSGDGGNLWLPVGAVQNAAGRSITATFTSFSMITVGAEGASFPVEWLAFEAIPMQDAVQLNWVTAWEQNNAFFAVERSLNGTTFEEIGVVTAVGNSATPVSYTLTDAALPADMTTFHYRIRQTDIDGRFSHSEIRTVTVDRASGFAVWPNPVQNQLHVQVPGGVYLISLTDAAGRILYTLPHDGRASLRDIDLGDLAAGVYTLRAGTASVKVAKD